MQCPNCGQGIEKAWSYCPKCGARFRRDFFSSVFSRMFSSMDRELKEMNKLMEKNIEALDISPFFRPQNRQQVRPFRAPASAKPRGSGFSIKIIRSGRNPPRVSVRTFGNVDKERVREQIQKQLGIRGRLEEVKGPGKPLGYVKPPERESRESPQREPKTVEEPKTEVRRLGNSVIVNLELPGVKSPDAINIKELESSLEVKAKAGDKAYFKILTKPGRFRLTKKGFSEGVLHLEFS